MIFLSCRGDRSDTRGTAFVVYEDIFDAKNAVDHLSGFNVCGRYLIVLYYQQSKMLKNQENVNNQAQQNLSQRTNVDDLKSKMGI